MTLPSEYQTIVNTARDAYLDSLSNPADAEKRNTYRTLESDVARLLDLTQDQAFELIALRPISLDMDRNE